MYNFLVELWFEYLTFIETNAAENLIIYCLGLLCGYGLWKLIYKKVQLDALWYKKQYINPSSSYEPCVLINKKDVFVLRARLSQTTLFVNCPCCENNKCSKTNKKCIFYKFKLQLM